MSSRFFICMQFSAGLITIQKFLTLSQLCYKNVQIPNPLKFEELFLKRYFSFILGTTLVKVKATILLTRTMCGTSR